MQKFIACLLLVVLLGMIPPLLPAQQVQSAQKLDSEMEVLKKRISALERQLQTVENVEKLDLQAKLAEANAKLINAGIDKYKRELRDSNDEWLRNWGIILLAFLSVVGLGVWSWLRSKTNQLIANEVEKNLNGFEAAVNQVEAMKDELGLLKKEHAATMLEAVINYDFLDERNPPERIKLLGEETLLQVFADERYHLLLRYKAAEVLAGRQSTELIPLLSNLLTVLADSELEIHQYYTVPGLPILTNGVRFLAHIRTREAYQALQKFLDYLLTDNPKRKNWFLWDTVSSLVQVGIKLNMGDSVPILTKALSDLENPGHEVLDKLVEYFHKFNEPASIKKILVNYLEDETYMDLPTKHLKDKCLELLQEHDPALVDEWRARETSDNSEA